jgi:branched-chain amino acid aminotransferase
LAGVKSTSYAENVLALAQATRLGASEAIFFNTRDELCEGTGSNVFVVRDGRVSTPPRSAGLLAGVTRRFVLGLAGSGITMAEEPITRGEFAHADEVFLTSTFQDVRVIGQVDGGERRTGPVTAELQQRFRAAAAAAWCWS